MGGLRKLRRKSRKGRYEVEPLRQARALPVRKMSEVLLDFAEPFLETLTDEQFEAGISFAAICWNISFLPEREQRKLLRSLVDELGKSDPLARFDVEDCARMLLERRRTLFADDRRMIVNYKVIDEGDSHRLLVMSAFTKD
ncbi:MAG: hypothetical protein ACE5NM_10685 [Sedimentisphaerales bacterium]